MVQSVEIPDPWRIPAPPKLAIAVSLPPDRCDLSSRFAHKDQNYPNDSNCTVSHTVHPKHQCKSCENVLEQWSKYRTGRVVFQPNVSAFTASMAAVNESLDVRDFVGRRSPSQWDQFPSSQNIFRLHQHWDERMRTMPTVMTWKEMLQRDAKRTNIPVFNKIWSWSWTLSLDMFIICFIWSCSIWRGPPTKRNNQP